MKKKIIMIVACVMCCAGLFGGCGQSGMKQDNTAISNSDEGKQDGTTEEKEVTGTIDEIKDFMFVVTDENDTPYRTGECQQRRYCDCKIYRNNFRGRSV